MAKQPTVTTLSSGYFSTETLNANFTALQEHFDNFLSLDLSTPNTFLADLDMNGNDILNVGTLDVNNITIDTFNLVDLIGKTSYAQDLNGLTLVNGDILYYDGSQLQRLPIGTVGQALKVSGGIPAWGTDNNTDTDTNTVGVTVEEDSTEISDEVTVINFVTGGAGAVTVDGGTNVVTVDLTAI